MTEHAIVVIGLPESGKTTFLAALWHLIIERDIDSALSFECFGIGDRTHLNHIASRWREARAQDHTALTGNRIVSMDLKNRDGKPVRLIFPDFAGEAYQDMWEKRECDPDIASYLHSTAVLLFIHADTVRAPKWIVDINALAEELGLPLPKNNVPVQWHARLAPTQVPLVDLLQMLQSSPLDVGRRRLAVIFSAWDKVEAEGLSPHEFLQSRLPLLAQYLTAGADSWTWRVYGLSAQGGDYDRAEPDARPSAQAKELRDLERASERIKLSGEHVRNSHDLTEPLAWLME
jgi:hypothetical protein